MIWGIASSLRRESIIRNLSLDCMMPHERQSCQVLFSSRLNFATGKATFAGSDTLLVRVQVADVLSSLRQIGHV
jgi:hypothetical protein